MIVIEQILRYIAWLEYPSWVWAIILAYFSIPFVFYWVLPSLHQRRYYQKNANDDASNKRHQVLVIVLGDLGHSPRMLYHVKSLVQQKQYKVQLFGYLQSTLPQFIVEGVDNGDIVINEISNGPESRRGILGMVTKVVRQHWVLFRLLFAKSVKNSKFVIIQNPPILPILHVVIVWKWLYSPMTKIVIDWHNLNYSILQLKFGGDNPGKIKSFLVQVMKFYEFQLSKFARYNLTVSANMKDYLINAIYPGASSIEKTVISRKFIVLRDRPADQFKVLDTQEQRITIMSKEFQRIFYDNMALQDFDFTKDDKIIVSSTSFTKDEDFNILLDAMKKYDQLMQSQPENYNSKIFLLVTGKGPEKPQFLSKIASLEFSQNIVIQNHWFTAAEYPKVISLADLAISLHLSSSGIDLPMKILDFFGCGIPTISVKFATIGELVKDGVNGYVLDNNTDDELCSMICKTLTNEKIYQKIKNGAIEESKHRWDDNWKTVLNDIV
ncbi:chitobiosyldiphosphodolichol beta-1,4 mannosyltransferase [Saccharomycopsis crataegensis]|uniref:Chitobiosyldiphosphodolichol beta-mannosyltransferase n=1 Tax=Saccharomycopsis crataegensis TaxID=43959 RepID=A0AAV5QLE0_9ASCO|nr:chitobiosyldiphosphodolichol beta-1,4 mannosyltransferase [Saccharomycopsis crataegensis]